MTLRTHRLMAGCWLLIALVFSCTPANAEVPHLIRYQGQVADSQGVPLEGPYTLTFRLYDAETGGTKLWEETQPTIPLTGGHFSVLLGQLTPFTVDWSQPCWLSVQVGTEPELSPRQRITSVPLAIYAEMAEQLDDTPRFQLDTGGTLPTDLVAYWKLNELSGPRADTKGPNTLADNNTVTQANGKVSKAAQFTRANAEYLSIADNADLSTGDIDFTVAAWAYLDSIPTTDAYIAFKGNSAGASTVEYGLRTVLDPGVLFNILVGKSGEGFASLNASTFGAPSTATWYFVVAWHDAVANTVNIQINNGTVDSVSYTLGSYDSAERFIIGEAFSGGSPGETLWNGRIDEVGFWKRVLTAQERSDLYNNGAGNTFNSSERLAVPVTTSTIADDANRLVPSGAIILWSGSACPAGYTRFSALDGRFLVADTTYHSSAGGSHTKDLLHTHGAGNYQTSSHDHGGSTGVGTPPPGAGDSGISSNPTSHTHPISTQGALAVFGTSTPGGVASLDIRPAFATVLVCKKD